MFEPSWLHPSYNEIHDACVEAKEMFAHYKFEFHHIAGVSRGGMLPAVILSHLLNLPLTPVSYSSKTGKGDDKNHVNQLPTIDAHNILIVDDICDSGNTLYELSNHYATTGSFVYTFALYYKSHKTPAIIPDFKWRTIPEDADWIIFPYETNKRIRTKQNNNILGLDL